nr:MAG TPA: hypothetical protein [Caudoviricetes sp.]
MRLVFIARQGRASLECDYNSSLSKFFFICKKPIRNISFSLAL